MRFGSIALDEAEGAILAHALHAPGLVFKKGRRLSAEDLARLREHGIDAVVAAVFEPDDVPEDEAAARLAAVSYGAGVRADEPFTGRVNLFATVRGVLVVDAARIDRLNAEHEAITLATLPAFAAIEPDQMVATIKIIPFAAPRPALERCVELAGMAPLLHVSAFRNPRVRLIQTELSGTSPKMLDKTVRITAERVQACGGELVDEGRSAHDPEALAAAIRAAEQRGFDILLIAGASAITDRRDVLPAAIELAGGEVQHYGMPVDPGNLLLLARLGGKPVLGLPGCARSPKLNGFDWVLQRLAAGLEVGRRDITAMGVGGLLMEIGTRPQPREQKPTESATAAPTPKPPAVPSRVPAEAPAPRIAAVVLAAGQSRRMGGPNKLLIEIDGAPMVRHAVDAALAAGINEIVVVTGHMREQVEAALVGRPIRFVHNPDYADGLSTSLKAGITALPQDVDGAVVMLGDMPRIRAAHLHQLIAAFDPEAGRSVVVPTWRGKRGNPVLWTRSFFREFRSLEGDVGARHLIGQHDEALATVELDDAASQIDIDTPEALAALTGASRGGG